METVANWEVARHETAIHKEVGMERKPLLTPDEYREGLRNTIGRNSLYSLLAAGKIKHLKVGRKILIPASELEAFPQREVEVAE